MLNYVGVVCRLLLIVGEKIVPQILHAITEEPEGPKEKTAEALQTVQQEVQTPVYTQSRSGNNTDSIALPCCVCLQLHGI